MNSKGKPGKRRRSSGTRAGSGRVGPGGDGLGAVWAALLSRPRSGAAPDVSAPLPHTPQQLGSPGPGPINSVAQFGAAGSSV